MRNENFKRFDIYGIGNYGSEIDSMFSEINSALNQWGNSPSGHPEIVVNILKRILQDSRDLNKL